MAAFRSALDMFAKSLGDGADARAGAGAPAARTAATPVKSRARCPSRRIMEQREFKMALPLEWRQKIGCLLPLDRGGWFRADVVHDPVDSLHFVHDSG